MSLGDLIIEAGGIPNDLFRYRAEVARIDTSNVNKEVFAETISLDIDINEMNQYLNKKIQTHHQLLKEYSFPLY